MSGLRVVWGHDISTLGSRLCVTGRSSWLNNGCASLGLLVGGILIVCSDGSSLRALGLVGQSKAWRHGLGRDHLDKDLLGILQSLVEGLILEILILAERHLLHFLLGIDKGDIPRSGGQDQLRLILEHHLDDLVCVSQENCLFGLFPLFDVDE